MDTGVVAVEVKQALARDLELCEKRISDGSWVNKLNLKRALDEKVLFFAKNNASMLDVSCENRLSGSRTDTAFEMDMTNR